KMIGYLSSWLLDLFAGYGYKPLRCFITYVLVIGAFMIIYYTQGMAYGPHISWIQSLILSMTAFHRRAFFPAQFQLSGPQAFTSAIESFVGLVIEIGLVVTFAQRFFRK
ncbi:MAG TPA: pentapeptide repeat-containing protein, partial [Ktedonobacteraceae bacterium]|nr:pentapeptide repeat-containing protein [Ktedonobacteraceae bacterium]